MANSLNQISATVPHRQLFELKGRVIPKNQKLSEEQQPHLVK
jgi:hypothetical protein